MIWKATPPKPKPKLGDRKECVRFAFFPRRFQGSWIWLEKYIAVYERQEVEYQDDEVVSSGIIFEKVRPVTRTFDMWIVVERKFLKQ